MNNAIAEPKVNKLRNHKLPNRNDILYIMKHFNSMPFQDIRKHLRITDSTLLNWMKLLLGSDDKEKRWREIEQNLNFLEMHESFDAEMASDYDVHDVKHVYGKNMYILKRRLVNEHRAYFMCSLNSVAHYIVHFDTPIDRNLIQYSPTSIGCDYDVCSMSEWEYLHLRHHLPVVQMESDGDFVGKFWCAMRNMVAYYEA
jgi:hypothetical protein